jgi:hypothetical protein
VDLAAVDYSSFQRYGYYGGLSVDFVGGLLDLTILIESAFEWDDSAEQPDSKFVYGRFLIDPEGPVRRTHRRLRSF